MKEKIGQYNSEVTVRHFEWPIKKKSRDIVSVQFGRRTKAPFSSAFKTCCFDAILF